MTSIPKKICCPNEISRKNFLFELKNRSSWKLITKRPREAFVFAKKKKKIATHETYTRGWYIRAHLSEWAMLHGLKAHRGKKRRKTSRGWLIGSVLQLKWIYERRQFQWNATRMSCGWKLIEWQFGIVFDNAGNCD